MQRSYLIQFSSDDICQLVCKLVCAGFRCCEQRGSIQSLLEGLTVYRFGSAKGKVDLLMLLPTDTPDPMTFGSLPVKYRERHFSTITDVIAHREIY